jgi:hypothetical protein
VPSQAAQVLGFARSVRRWGFRDTAGPSVQRRMALDYAQEDDSERLQRFSGEQLARQYTGTRHSLVLVDHRRLDGLQKLADELRQNYRIDVVVEQVDRSDVSAAIRLQIGAVAAFLASSDSSFMTASEVAVDGGLAQL